MSKSQDRVSSRWHIQRAGAVPYSAAVLVILGLFVYLSLHYCSWTWLSRGGGAIILLGVVLGFRRLFRVGPVRNAEEDEPLVIQRNQFNVTGMWQRVERITDSYAQAFGLGLIVFGTVLAAFGDEIAELVLPIAFICTG
jgi:hypothetical protein